MKLFFLVSAFVLSTIDSFPQSAGLGSWNILNLKYDYNDYLSVFGEAQLRSLRFYDDYHYYEVKGGVNYKIHKNARATLAAGSYQTYAEGGTFETPKNNNEFRLWPQLILTQDIYRLKIEQRYRTEMRWTSNGYRNRFRYRIGLSYPFGADTKGYRPFQASISNELFFTDNEPYFERNRAQVTINFRTSKSSTIQIGYLHQFDYKINDETGKDFLVIGLYYEFFRKVITKRMQEDGINDN